MLVDQKDLSVRDARTMVRISCNSNTIYSIMSILLLDYYRSSAICTECLTVPVSILVAVLFILLTIYGLIRKGISASQLTQVPCILIRNSVL